MDLTVTPELDPDGRRVLHVAGDLDLASRDTLLVAAETALADPDGDALVLELSEITFIDSSGIGALVTIARDADDHGRSFALRAPSDRVSRILRIAGLHDLWPIDSVTN